jgi:acyl-coenzyme A synthetase/AMP-(fatty) acid ligase
MNAVAYCLLHGLKIAGPERPALVCAAETLSYGALAARVGQFAAGLRALGIGANDRVAMLMLDTPDLIALHLAVMAAGAIAVTISSRATAEELARILAIVRPAALLIDVEFEALASDALAAAAPGTKLLRRDRALAAWKAGPAAPLEPVARAPQDPAFWVMTSGTTGQPKAVEHRHGNVGICADYYRQVLGATADDRLFATSRFHFAYAVGNMFAALRLGAANILMERWATADSVQATVERFAPTILLSVPALYHRLLEAGCAHTPAFRALRWFVSAGERLPPQIWSAWENASGHPILDGLGCSELVYMVIGNTPEQRRPGSSGHPMPGVELRIVGEDGALIAEAERTGRLQVRMPSVCAGYRDLGSDLAAPPERPTERFKPGGWFATGDEYLRDADGFYHHRGRTGDMLRVAGLWISPSEIEDALAGIPSIVETAAVLGENDIGLAEVVLYILPVVGANGEVAIAAARERLAEVLPSYKQPRRFEVVPELPRTATGKLQRHKLRDRLRHDPH